MDATEILRVEPTVDGQSVNVDFEESNARLDAWADRHGGVPEIIIVTGFIASNAAGQVRPATALRVSFAALTPSKPRWDQGTATVVGAVAFPSLEVGKI
jgi:hypothetical protein